RQGCIPTGCNINGYIPVSTKRHIPTECEAAGLAINQRRATPYVSGWARAVFGERRCAVRHAMSVERWGCFAAVSRRETICITPGKARSAATRGGTCGGKPARCGVACRVSTVHHS
ncbi:MAG: hypothetical protein LBT61_00345, partial [Prevotellaceae bacterium]|nr:hypothetical protein [Prevotellaceae bacterium]